MPSQMRWFMSSTIDGHKLHHNVGTCLWHVSLQTANYQHIGNMPKACPYVMALSFWETLTHSLQQIQYNFLGFFAVKRRAVFIFGAMWIALVRGWQRDCVVGGMETRFQWRKAHSRTAKCETFHVAPRLFFMFLFLIAFTILQQCIIIAPSIYPLNPLNFSHPFSSLFLKNLHGSFI